jgi:peptide-methionine (R)-S-oxide reductase
MSRTINRRLFLGLVGTGAVAGLAFVRPGRSVAATYEVQRSPADWRRRLGDVRYRILREQGTERPFTSSLLKEHRKGVFACAGCALPLFSSNTKYDSGTGWPSFYAALPDAIRTTRDFSLGMIRVEEHCRRCGGHLGHIFDGGPRPTGKRHCINGLSLIFRPS